MTYKELFEKVISREVKLDYNGHSVFGFYEEKRLNDFLEEIEENIKFWENTESSKWVLDVEVKEGITYSPLLPDLFNCSKCGEKLGWYYLPEKTLKCISKDFNCEEFKIDRKPKINYDRCTIEISPVVIYTIEIKDSLVFSNFFRYYMNLDLADKSEININTDISLQSIKGRINLSKFYAQHNVGYAQTGNMSVEVFVSKNKDEILIVDSYPHSETSSELLINDCDLGALGYDLVGEISCDMWRWMCANKSDLESTEWLLDEYKEHSEDYFIIDNLKTGTWEVIDYFNSDSFTKEKRGKINIMTSFKFKTSFLEE